MRKAPEGSGMAQGGVNAHHGRAVAADLDLQRVARVHGEGPLAIEGDGGVAPLDGDSLTVGDALPGLNGNDRDRTGGRWEHGRAIGH